MKALTLWQPWATLVAIGEKKFETRSWKTTFRGPLIIHSAVRPFVGQERDCLMNYPAFRGALDGVALPLGCLLAIVDLTDCISTNDLQLVNAVSGQERTFGDYSEGRFAWKLENLRKFSGPVRCNGARQLWDVPAEAMALLPGV